MPVRYTCPQCQVPLQIPRKKLGKTIDCPRCRFPILIPADLPDEPAGSEPVPRAKPTNGALSGSHAPGQSGSGQSGFGQSGFGQPGQADLPPPVPILGPPVPVGQPLSQNPPAVAPIVNVARESAEAKLYLEFAVYDDPEDAAVVVDPSAHVGLPASSAPQMSAVTTAFASASALGPVAAAPRPAPAASRAEPSSTRGLMQISWRVLLLQYLVMILLAGGAYAVGYWLGQHDVQQIAAMAPPRTDSVIVEGKLFFEPRPGEVAPDAGAIVLFLPESQAPLNPWAAEGLRGSDPNAGPDPDRLIHLALSVGGNGARAGREGHFVLSLPRPGQYRLLYLARQAQRRPGEPPRAGDVPELERFYEDPVELLGRRKYHWTRLEITGPLRILDPYDFDAPENAMQDAE